MSTPSGASSGPGPHVAHHFDTVEQQREAGKLGMWIFLATEVLLFGGLFCAYTIYRANHPEIFVYAHQFLDSTLGGINTLVLIGSSLTMAFAVRSAQLGRQKALVTCLVLTLIGGFGFMGIKAVEYQHKWKHGLLWGARYRSQEEHVADAAGSGEPAAVAPAVAPPAAGTTSTADPERSTIRPAARGPGGLIDLAAHREAKAHEAEPANVQVFFGIYFVMTGLHGLHVLVGMFVIGWLALRARRGDFGPHNFAAVDLGGLYWHLVDVIWIFLFPLLYLIH